jgi:hypothetical protein
MNRMKWNYYSVRCLMSARVASGSGVKHRSSGGVSASAIQAFLSAWAKHATRGEEEVLLEARPRAPGRGRPTR